MTPPGRKTQHDAINDGAPVERELLLKQGAGPTSTVPSWRLVARTSWWCSRLCGAGSSCHSKSLTNETGGTGVPSSVKWRTLIRHVCYALRTTRTSGRRVAICGNCKINAEDSDLHLIQSTGSQEALDHTRRNLRPFGLTTLFCGRPMSASLLVRVFFCWKWTDPVARPALVIPTRASSLQIRSTDHASSTKRWRISRNSLLAHVWEQTAWAVLCGQDGSEDKAGERHVEISAFQRLSRSGRCAVAGSGHERSA